MSTKEVLNLVDQLGEDLDDLQENLEPLLSKGLLDTSKKLPLLDKAKIYATTVYAIESLLFSYLKINGVSAKDHPIFVELTRVKQYFTKIQEAEDGPVKPRENMSLNKEAAGRIIKHALAGNNKIDLERAEKEAKEKLLAKRKLIALETAMKEKAQLNETPIRTENIELSEDGEIEESLVEVSNSGRAEHEDERETLHDEPIEITTKKSKREKKKRRSENMSDDAKAEKRARKKAKKEAKAQVQESMDSPVDGG